MKAGLAAIAALILATGCATAPAPEAATSPKGYVIVEIDVTNPEAYEGYKAAVAPMVAAAGGRYLVRGGKAEGRERTNALARELNVAASGMNMTV
jgi:hypothetical protein